MLLLIYKYIKVLKQGENMSFGQRLKQLREENGISQIALVNQLGITEEDINKFENDDTMPSAEILVKLSSLYNMSVDELLGNSRKTESDYRYKYSDERVIFYVKADLDKKEEIKEIIDSLNIVD